ncbi:MAG TPA: hypothetical protein VEX36_02035 [Thermoleophilaceae bacterium]|nr:hypothetical protein [Thermoleophilaceae bacterium]
MSELWRVPLPPGAKPPLRVFVNAVPQEEGRDYELGDRELLFSRPLMKERVGFWRWTAMFLALFGTYGRNDSVDVEYTVGGRKTVATALEIIAPDGSRSVAG